MRVISVEEMLEVSGGSGCGRTRNRCGSKSWGKGSGKNSGKGSGKCGSKSSGKDSGKQCARVVICPLPPVEPTPVPPPFQP